MKNIKKFFRFIATAIGAGFFCVGVFILYGISKIFPSFSCDLQKGCIFSLIVLPILPVLILISAIAYIFLSHHASLTISWH